jgi:hypothetical protein
MKEMAEGKKFLLQKFLVFTAGHQLTVQDALRRKIMYYCFAYTWRNLKMSTRGI